MSVDCCLLFAVIDCRSLYIVFVSTSFADVNVSLVVEVCYVFKDICYGLFCVVLGWLVPVR